VKESGAGLVTEPGDARALVDAILYLKRTPVETERMSRNARSYFERHLTLDRGRREFAKLLREVAGEGVGEPGVRELAVSRPEETLERR
jgi:glycosyltransferase involved in cell wall biosynthesis